MERRKFITDTVKYAALSLVGTSMLNNNLFGSNQRQSTFKSYHSSGSMPAYENVTTIVKLKGKEVKVHALCTGKVAVKTNFRKKKEEENLLN